MNSRLNLLATIFFLLTAALIVRLFSLQVLSHENFRELAENQHELYRTLTPVRGQILVMENKDGRMVPAVTNIEKNLIYAEPQKITEKEKTAALLAKALALPKAEIFQKLAADSRKWVVLKKAVPESEALAVTGLKLPGIGLEPETFRYYPEKEFASQVLGFYAFSDDERTGRYGIEEQYQKQLAGAPGSLALEKDARGAWITGSTRKVIAAVNGADIVLTIDRAIQYQADAILKSAVERFQAEDGSLVVLDPKTGRILALANVPTFDPNSFNTVEDAGFYRNRAVSDAYEPGSVFKPITMSAGIDSGAVTPDLTFEDTGSVSIDKYTIKNALERVFGVQTMNQVLEKSINTGAIFVQQRTGRDRFREVVKKFGFGVKTDITLPSESPGDVRNLERGGDIHYATASFGQGITVTTLQLAKAYAAIANSGKMMKPYIVEKIDYKTGQVETFAPQEVTQVVSAKAAHTVGAMLVNVVENGHGKRAAVPGYYFGGKTGTAQIARSDGPGYDPDRTIGTFAGFGPIDDPRFVIVVKITNPQGARFAESTAAPTFGEMARFLVNYYQIPPSR